MITCPSKIVIGTIELVITDQLRVLSTAVAVHIPPPLGGVSDHE